MILDFLKNLAGKDLRVSEDNDFQIQNDNAIDEYNRKTIKENPEWYLESCGVSACITCINYLIEGQLSDIKVGNGVITPEDVLWCWMNNKNNYDLMRESRPLDLNYFVPNRVPQYYPIAVKTLFNIKAEFIYDNFNRVIDEIKKGNTIQLCLIKPGHYISAVNYNKEKDEIICKDPNIKNNGKFDRINREVYKNNVKPYIIIYYKPTETNLIT